MASTTSAPPTTPASEVERGSGLGSSRSTRRSRHEAREYTRAAPASELVAETPMDTRMDIGGHHLIAGSLRALFAGEHIGRSPYVCP